MRKGIDSLCGIVKNELNKSPLLGDLFIFINRRRNQIKMLHWQGDGFAVFYKRLEKGTYEVPTAKNNCAEITAEQLLFILQGVVLKSVKKKPRYSLSFVEKN
jgi:transposase